jgi:hypothetical protein
MKVKFIRITTLLENDKKFTMEQRYFFKATRLYDFNVIYPTNTQHRRIYMFAYDRADIIHIGILGKIGKGR